MVLRSLLFAVLLVGSCVTHAQSIAFTFDDGFDPRKTPEAARLNAAMLAALANAHVQGLLIPAGSRVDSEAGLALVRDWGKAGHWIGNHTYSHANYGREAVTFELFTQDILRNETLLKDAPGWHRLLRFPYLKEGATARKRDAMRDWLHQRDYRVAAVSIDTSDWYYDDRLTSWVAAHPGADLAGFRTAYLAHIWDRAQYYDGLSRRVLKRSAKHVILLHTNGINARFVGDLIQMFRERGWTIVAPGEAFDDPLYSSVPDTLPAGESILWALAKQAGVAELRYPAEDGRYEERTIDDLEAQR